MISIVCAVKNRTPALRVSLSSWLLSAGVGEIVVVDWSSDEPVRVDDPRVRTVRVEGETLFHLAAAFNLGADVAKGEKILKMDADYVLNPYYDFIGEVVLPERSFITGHWSQEGPFLRNLNGMVYVRKSDWGLVNGYNENLTGYGWDDDDFYSRLSASGLERRILSYPPLYMFHIPHNDNFRVENYKNKDIKDSHTRNRLAAHNPYNSRVFEWDMSIECDNAIVAKKKSKRLS